MAIGASGNKTLTALWFVDRPQAVRLVKRAFDLHKGNVTRAAEALHVARATLYRWVHTYPELSELLTHFDRSKGRPPQ
jgi:transposase